MPATTVPVNHLVIFFIPIDNCNIFFCIEIFIEYRLCRRIWRDHTRSSGWDGRKGIGTYALSSQLGGYSGENKMVNNRDIANKKTWMTLTPS